jgi:glutamyl-tRNA synthetase
MSSPVVTRFAPSPTGFLHIGGARTALFNWLFTRHAKGKMLLRIEDTDRQRSTDAAVAAILDGLAWLGLEWDGEPVSQWSRSPRHREVAETLLAQGQAYRCYSTPEELEAMRARAKAEGRPQRYDGTWRNRSSTEVPEGIPPVVRFKAPLEGRTIIEDEVQGAVAFQNKDLDDLVILRSDGSPTYNLSVVVDDHDMGVTHIIRGVDHLTNAARQTQIYQALGWRTPIMAHIPLIHGPDGAKLSKRHGALGVEAYRAMGYLPQAMRNYLARLGWSHGDDEIFSTDQMIEWFSLAGIGRSAARFDFAKLENLNGHYIRAMADGELLDALASFLHQTGEGQRAQAMLDGEVRRKLLKAMPGLKERAKTLRELASNARFLVEVPEPDEAARRLLNSEGKEMLRKAYPALAATTKWTAHELDKDLRRVAEANNAKLGMIAQPLRAALTGSTTSPGIFEVMEALGREESLRRIERYANTGQTAQN